MELFDRQTIFGCVRMGRTMADAAILQGQPLTGEQRQWWREARLLADFERAEKKKAIGEAGFSPQSMPLSGAERKRRHLEREASIDDALDAALDAIDWRRRSLASRSLHNFLRLYCMEPMSRLLDYPPVGDLVKVVHDMQRGISDDSVPYHIRMPRGEGKSALTKGAGGWAAATGTRKFIVVFSAARPDAVQIVDDILMVLLNSEKFAADFPEIALPLRMIGGSFKRRQFYNGHPTAMVCRTGRLVLPTIIAKRDFPQLGIKAGQPFPSSGTIFDARGFSGHARGMAKGAARPDLLILDDLQHEGDAANEETVRKNAEHIRKGILNMGGRKRIAAVMTSTPIEPGDLSEEFASDPEWRTRTYRAFKSFPTDWAERGMDGLWGSYIRIYRHAVAHGDPNPTRPANEFYKANRAAMDAGASVISRHRFDRKTQLSAIQAKMDKLFQIGPVAFEAEYQMKPRRHQFVFELTAQTVLDRVRKGLAPATIPQGFDFIAAATDINPSYALTTAVVAFDRDRTALVVWHWIDPISIDDTVNDTVFVQRIYDALAAHGRVIAASKIPINGWGIDASGKQFQAVTAFAPNAQSLCGIPAIAMTGRNSMKFNPFVRSRVRDAVNNTVLCAEKAANRQWLVFNADLFREAMQLSWATETGAPGGLSLFDGGVSHDDFAEQVSREKLRAKRSRPDGRTEYDWKTADPHDFGDCVTMCYAIAAASGIAAAGMGNSIPKKRKRYRYVNPS